MSYAKTAICSLHGAWDIEKSPVGCPSCMRGLPRMVAIPEPTPHERIATALERIANALERRYRPDSPEIR
jgi:hypothetical protein